MIFSISKYLGFSDNEILSVFKEGDVEITAVREPQEFQKAIFLQGR